jgi:XTP/dITP diphosphohydrolase
MARIHFLTSNQGKVREAALHLEPLGHDVLQLHVEGIVEPQSDDLEAVARSKIEQAKTHLPSKDAWILVEDAGLFVRSLDGFPGVYSAHALNTIGCAGLLRLLSHLQSKDLRVEAGLREAEFRAVACLRTPEGVLVGHGRCPGRIAVTQDGEGGFGFDPIFIPRDLDLAGQPVEAGENGEISTHGRTFAAVEPATKDVFSHRARALKDLFAQVPSER